jgi:hypothetical protein
MRQLLHIDTAMVLVFAALVVIIVGSIVVASYVGTPVAMNAPASMSATYKGTMPAAKIRPSDSNSGAASGTTGSE